MDKKAMLFPAVWASVGLAAALWATVVQPPIVQVGAVSALAVLVCGATVAGRQWLQRPH
jgi:hypothetical protein